MGRRRRKHARDANSGGTTGGEYNGNSFDNSGNGGSKKNKKHKQVPMAKGSSTLPLIAAISPTTGFGHHYSHLRGWYQHRMFTDAHSTVDELNKAYIVSFNKKNKRGKKGKAKGGKLQNKSKATTSQPRRAALIVFRDSISALRTFKIVKQIEYYFSDNNLACDTHLLRQIANTQNGFVSLEHICSFNKMKSLCRREGWPITAAALWTASSKLRLNPACTHVCRRESLGRKFLVGATIKSVDEIGLLLQRGIVSIPDLVTAVSDIMMKAFGHQSATKNGRKFGAFNYQVNRKAVEVAHAMVGLVWTQMSNTAKQSTIISSQSFQAADSLTILYDSSLLNETSGGITQTPASDINLLSAKCMDTKARELDSSNQFHEFSEHVYDSMMKLTQCTQEILIEIALSLGSSGRISVLACSTLMQKISSNEKQNASLTSGHHSTPVSSEPFDSFLVYHTIAGVCRTLEKQPAVSFDDKNNNSTENAKTCKNESEISQDQCSLRTQLQIIAELYKKAVYEGGDAIVYTVGIFAQKIISLLLSKNGGKKNMKQASDLVGNLKYFLASTVGIKDKAVLDRTVSLRDHEREYPTLASIDEKFSTYGTIQSVNTINSSNKPTVHITFNSTVDADRACIEFTAASNSWRFGPKVSIASGRKPKKQKKSASSNISGTGDALSDTLTQEEKNAEEAASVAWFKSKLTRRTNRVKRLAASKSGVNDDDKKNTPKTCNDSVIAARYAKGPETDPSHGFKWPRSIQYNIAVANN